ncbi:pyruvate,orthophosphate dikinase [Streptomyces sp. CG 926]|nr:pyruvate,orthophosphate dikinase [Streptomyces sp. CG 926]
MQRYVYDLTEDGPDTAASLGDKGAGLAEMTRMGLPVPPGFTVTTEACRVFLATGEPPVELAGQMAENLAVLEQRVGKRLGQVNNPLLLSVRPGAGSSTPGGMETVLDVGLNDLSVLGLGVAPGNERFAWDSYRRLVRMFGSTVMGVDDSLFEEVILRIERHHAVADEGRLDAVDLIRLVETFKDLIAERTGGEFPQDPAEQLRLAVVAAFASWNGERARLHRRRGHLLDPGIAVSVQSMVFGNLGPDSGSGVAFTRDPATGRRGVYGRYLPNAQGEDVVDGIRDTVPLGRLAELAPGAYARLHDCMERLEDRYDDRCDIEFTVERGTLWMLQTDVGKRRPQGASAPLTSPSTEASASAQEGRSSEPAGRKPPPTIGR